MRADVPRAQVPSVSDLTPRAAKGGMRESGPNEPRRTMTNKKRTSTTVPATPSVLKWEAGFIPQTLAEKLKKLRYK